MSREQLLADTPNTSAKYNQGELAIDEYGNVYEYVKFLASQTLAVGSVVLLLQAGADLLDDTNGASGVGSGAAVGLCIVALTSNSAVTYGWVLRKTGHGQTASIIVLAGVAKYTGLQTTSVSGTVDDATGGADIVGMVITTAQGTAAGGTNTTAILDFPRILETFA